MSVRLKPATDLDGHTIKTELSDPKPDTGGCSQLLMLYMIPLQKHHGKETVLFPFYNLLCKKKDNNSQPKFINFRSSTTCW